MRSHLWAIYLLSFLLPAVCWGHEVLTLVRKNCESKSGFVVSTDSEKVRIMGLDGQWQDFLRSEISEIYVHNLVQNPIRGVAHTRPGSSDLYSVRVAGDRDEYSFRGWAVGFVDDLVFFLNDSGQVDVIEIRSLRALKKIDNVDISFHGNPQELQFPKSSGCLASKNTGVAPLRILSDQIQVQEFLGNYEKGFFLIESLMERMDFYSKPHLFPDTFRFGFGSYGNSDAPSLIPLYVRWSGGEAFGLQSSSMVGAGTSEWAPSPYPQTIGQTEIKSHFFHGLVLAQMAGISPGSNLFRDYMQPEGRQIGKKVPLAGVDSESEIVSGLGWNYMALFGFDYQAWSVSFGGFYPVHYFFLSGDSREVLSRKPAPIIRLMWNKENIRLRGIYSDIKLRETPSAKDDFFMPPQLHMGRALQ